MALIAREKSEDRDDTSDNNGSVERFTDAGLDDDNVRVGKQSSPIFGSGAPVVFESKAHSESWQPSSGVGSQSLGLLAKAPAKQTTGALATGFTESQVSVKNQTDGNSAAAAAAQPKSFVAQPFDTPPEARQAFQPFDTPPDVRNKDDVARDHTNGNFDSESQAFNDDALKGKTGPSASVSLFSSPKYDGYDEENEEKAVKCCAAWSKARRAKKAEYKKSMESLNVNESYADKNVHGTDDDLSIAGSTATVSVCCLFLCLVFIMASNSNFVYNSLCADKTIKRILQSNSSS